VAAVPVRGFVRADGELRLLLVLSIAVLVLAKTWGARERCAGSVEEASKRFASAATGPVESEYEYRFVEYEYEYE
jgi:hypothetical protein